MYAHAFAHSFALEEVPFSFCTFVDCRHCKEMSALLRFRQASFVGRRLVPRSWRTLQEQQERYPVPVPTCREFAWAPPAYRRQKGMPRKRMTPRNKVNGSGEQSNKLWTQLQEVYGESGKETVTTTTKNKSDYEWALTRRQGQLQEVQEEFRGVLHRYQNELFPQEKKRKGGDPKENLIDVLLNNLHEHCSSVAARPDDDDISSVVPTWQVILDTEPHFRDLGKLMRHMIALVARRPATTTEHDDDDDDDASDASPDTRNSYVAEKWLRALIQLRSDRDHLVQMAQHKSRLQPKKEQSTSSTWTGWLTQILFVPQLVKQQEEEESPESTTEPDDDILLVHQKKSFGPTKRQFLDVIMSIRREAQQFQWEPDDDHWDELFFQKTTAMFDEIRVESQQKRQDLLACGHRMSALLDLLILEGIPPIPTITQPCIETFLQVGSLDSAACAEHIYTDICQKRVSREMFHLVLKAYRLAARMEENAANRAHAATRAHILLQEREQYQLADIYNSTPESDDPRRESYSIVLETYGNIGWKAIPNVIGEAEKLVKLYLGERMFTAVVEYNNNEQQQSAAPPPKVDMQVFESLLHMYTFKPTPKRYMRAKNILKCAEDVRIMATTTGPTSSAASNKDESVESFPNYKTYNAILAGTRRKINGIRSQIKRLDGGEHESEMLERRRLQQVIQDEAWYATSFLDRMTLHPSSFPDPRTFEYLLDIWAGAAMPESGERADEILSHMSIRQACVGPTFSLQGKRIYAKALQCWVKSAEVSVPGALDRALRVLDKMEAATGIIHTTPIISAVDSYSDAEKNILSLVYEKDDTEALQSAYKAGIYICSLCSEDDPEAALEAAFDLYNRMIAAGISPDEQIFIHLLSCCANLVPQDQNRQKILAKTVMAFAGDFGMNLNELNKKLKMEIMARR
jgi:hypothetical protein